MPLHTTAHRSPTAVPSGNATAVRWRWGVRWSSCLDGRPGHFWRQGIWAWLLLASLTGCATGRLGNPFETAARKQSKSATEPDTKTETDARKVAGLTDKSASPAADAGKPAEAAKPAGGTTPPTVAAQAPAKPASSAAAPATKGTSLDAETLALIDRELRDATPDERVALFNELKSVHPQMVKEILRIRRMGIQYREQQRAVAEASPSVPDGIQTASAQVEAARIATGPGTGAAGLGANPWDAGSVRHAAARVPLGGHTALGTTDSIPLSRSGDTVATAGYTPAGTPPAAPNSPGVVPGSGVVQAYAQSPATGAPVPGGRVQPIGGTVPAETAPLPDPGRTAALVPGQYDIPPAQGWVAAVPGKAASVAQPVVANVQRALHDLSRPILPGQTREAAAAHQALGGTSDPAPPRSSWSSSDATEPAPSPELARLIDAMEQFTASLKPGTTAEEQHFYIEQHVYLRMLYLIASRHERALQAIPGISPADQEFWQQTLWGMANYFDIQHLPRESDRATQTVAQFATAISRLQQKAQLHIRNTHFCRRIDNYGSYERFDRDEFTPGQPVLLYAEIENFHTEQAADGRYRTLLKSTLEVYRAGTQGELVDRFEFPATEDLCRNPRRDYFHSYEFTIPTKLGLGPHVLKLTLEDQLTRKVATYSVNFSVK